MEKQLKEKMIHSVMPPKVAIAYHIIAVCLFVCLSVCLFVCLSVCLFACLSVCLFDCLSVLYVLYCIEALPYSTTLLNLTPPCSPPAVCGKFGSRVVRVLPSQVPVLPHFYCYYGSTIALLFCPFPMGHNF